MPRSRRRKHPRWRDEARRLLAENRETLGRPDVERVARRVGVSERTMYRLIASLRDEFAELTGTYPPARTDPCSIAPAASGSRRASRSPSC